MKVRFLSIAQFLYDFQTFCKLEVFIDMETKMRTCTMCKLDLPEDDTNFASRHDRGKKQFQSNCRECQKNYRRQHYLNNKQKYIDKSQEYKKTFTEWFIEYKKTLSCECCGENRYWVLDFHHKDPKEKDLEVSLVVRQCSKQKLLEEIEKCMVVCSNCHRDIHYKERQAGVV